MISSFIEKPERFSEFLTSSSSDGVPKLIDLKVELKRIRPGMSDFVIRVSTPKFASIKSGTVVSIRGDKSFASFTKVKELADFIGTSMEKYGDKCYNWQNLDTDHLANMLIGSLKYFVQRPNTETIQMVTEALS